MPNDATERKTTPNFCVENKQRHFVIKVSPHPHVMSEVHESSNESSKMTDNTQYAAKNTTKNPKNCKELDENCKKYFTTDLQHTTKENDATRLQDQWSHRNLHRYEDGILPQRLISHTTVTKAEKDGRIACATFLILSYSTERPTQ